MDKYLSHQETYIKLIIDNSDNTTGPVENNATISKGYFKEKIRY